VWSTDTVNMLASTDRLLTPWWADFWTILGIFGTAVTCAGLVVSAVALWLTLRQVKAQTAVAVAASAAAETTFEELRSEYEAHITAMAVRHFRDVKRHVQQLAWPEALTRLGDFREQFAQFRSADEAEQHRFMQLRKELGDWESRFRTYEATGEGFTARTRSGWLKFCRAVDLELGGRAAPLSGPSPAVGGPR
jgi:hypothetical protein